MPRSNARAGTVQLNRIHRLVARAIERELKKSLKDGGEVPAPLLGRAIDFLKMTDVTDPQRDPPTSDPLAHKMPDFGPPLGAAQGGSARATKTTPRAPDAATGASF